MFCLQLFARYAGKPILQSLEEEQKAGPPPGPPPKPECGGKSFSWTSEFNPPDVSGCGKPPFLSDVVTPLFQGLPSKKNHVQSSKCFSLSFQVYKIVLPLKIVQFYSLPVVSRGLVFDVGSEGGLEKFSLYVSRRRWIA